jgi:hypothetical protein
MANKEVVVEPAKPEDAKGIAELQMDAFSDEGFQELFPPKDGVGLEYSIRAWASHIAEAAKPTTGIRPAVYVIRGDDGKFCASQFTLPHTRQYLLLASAVTNAPIKGKSFLRHSFTLFQLDMLQRISQIGDNDGECHSLA